MERAIFGAGCFWGVEDAFRQVNGVTASCVGYAGGEVEHPTYEQVCRGTTGHTEVVEVIFDPAIISYEALLQLFGDMHDPTLPKETQYKSVIFYLTPAQRTTAERWKQRVAESGQYARPVVTDILPAATFYPAEEYHQQYYKKHGISGCDF